MSDQPRHRRLAPRGQRAFAWALALATSTLLGCGDDTTRAPPGQFVRSEHQRLAAATDLGDARTLAANNADFAFALLRAAAPTGNFFFSPHSISLALAMTYAGAAGDTAADMRSALRFRQDPTVLHPAFNTLDQTLTARGQDAHGLDGTPFRLRITSALFAQQGFPILPSYLDLIAEHYGAGVSLLDFVTAPEPARQAINAWVAAVTEGRIPELLPQGAIDPSTVLVLTNAVYFNAAWDDAFAEASTAPGTFTLPDGSSVTVPLMHGRVGTTLAVGTGWRAAEIPYEGADISFLLVVPDDLAAFEATLDGARYQAIVAALQPGDVAITLPRFATRSQLSLRPALSALGMARAFEAADLSALSPVDGLFISDVIHEAWVRVNEKGTEAAAATAVIVGRVSLPAEVVANRPFLFFVRDRPTGAILFAGRVVDPRP